MPSDNRRNPQGQGGKTPPPPPNRGVSVPPKRVYTQDGSLRPPPPPPKGKPEPQERTEKPARAAPSAPLPKEPTGKRDLSAPPPAVPKGKTEQTSHAAKSAPPRSPAANRAKPAAPRSAPPPKESYAPAKKNPLPDEPDDEMESQWRGIKLRKKPPVNNGCMRGALYFTVICVLSLVMAVNIWSWVNDVLALTKEEGFLTVTIPEDYDYKSLSKQLQDLGIIEHAWLFEMYCDLSDAQEYIDPGEREVNLSHDYRALVRDLRYVEEKVQVKITFPEGITMEGIVDLLVENGVARREALLEQAANADFGYSFLDDLPATENRLEGYLFPDTYFFYTDENPRSALSKFLAAYNQKLSKKMRERIEEMPYTMHEIITIASLIQAEAANVSEMKEIASVIYNRLNSSNFPHLEIDASLLYVMDGRRVITAEDKLMDNPYNLYVAEGLPPGPVCSPSINAIRAALYPSHTGYYYYALTDNGTHQFSKTYNEHLQVIRNNPKAHPNG